MVHCRTLVLILLSVLTSDLSVVNKEIPETVPVVRIFVSIRQSVGFLSALVSKYPHIHHTAP